jgi:hypothetical protein
VFLMLHCWWDRYDVCAFLQAPLSEDAMAQVERASTSPPSWVLSLVEMIQQAKDRMAAGKPDERKEQAGRARRATRAADRIVVGRVPGFFRDWVMPGLSVLAIVGSCNLSLT